MAPADWPRQRLMFLGIAVGVATPRFAHRVASAGCIAAQADAAADLRRRSNPQRALCGADPVKALITYNFVVYYVATTNMSRYQALLNDSAGTKPATYSRALIDSLTWKC